MTTQTTKFWPDAKVPAGAVYIGSEHSDAKYDYYIDRDRLFYVWEGNDTYRMVDDVLKWGRCKDNKNWTVAASLIRYYENQQQLQPPATTPATSREELVEKMQKAIELGSMGCGGNASPRQVANYVVEQIFPDLKPAPPKVSENERVAAVIASRWTEHPWTRNECTKEIIAALDARDAQHRLALESLREGMIGGARLWLQTIGHGGSKISDYDYSRLTDILNRVPLATTPEAK